MYGPWVRVPAGSLDKPHDVRGAFLFMPLSDLLNGNSKVYQLADLSHKLTTDNGLIFPVIQW